MSVREKRPQHLFPVLAILGCTLLLYSVGLTYSPPYLHEAEVLFGLHAHSIATTGHDIYGRFMPLYFQMRPLGDNTWWHPVLVYFTALVLTAAPLTEAVLRFPSVLVGAINAVLVYHIAGRLFGNPRYAVGAALLLVITPSHFIQSRIAMDYIYPVPFTLGWLLSLLVYLERPRARVLFVGTTILGIGVYSYLAAVIMMPLYLAATVGVLLATRCRAPKHWLAALAGFAWPLVLVPVWLWSHPDILVGTLNRYKDPAATPFADSALGMSLREVLEELRKPEHFTSLPGRMSLYWYFFDPIYLFVYGGYASVMNSTRHVGVFLLPFIVLVPVGLWQLARSRTIESALIVFLFLTAPAAALAVPEPYAVDREMILVPAGVLVAVAGLRRLRAQPSRWARHAVTAILVALPIHFGFFLFDYYVDYRKRAGFWYGFNKSGALSSLLASEAQQPASAIYLSTARDPFLESYWQLAVAKEGRNDLLSKTSTVDGATFDIAAAPAGALILLNRADGTTDATLARPDVIREADVPEIADPQQYWVIRKR